MNAHSASAAEKQFLIPTKVFLFVNKIVGIVLDSATAGTKFLFGRLALAPGTTNESSETSLGSILAFQALPTIIFFAGLIGALYYLRIMPLIIRGFKLTFTTAKPPPARMASQELLMAAEAGAEYFS